MKKLLGIVVLGLLWCNISMADGTVLFYCDTIDGNEKDQSFKINLNNRTMEFGPYFEYKITKINDESIVAWTVQPDTDGSKQSLTFNRYTGKLTLVRHKNPPFFWRMKCRKIDKKKKIL